MLATRCSLPTHVGSVIGYTAIVGAVSLLFGDLAVGLGLYGPLAAIGMCTAVLFAVKSFFGKRVVTQPA